MIGQTPSSELSSNYPLSLDPAYSPSDDEPFMSDQQLLYFKSKLERWKYQLLQESADTLQHLQEDSRAEPDVVDSAANETERTLELRARDRARKLINKIDEALRRIDEGSYGYCDETGEPIGVKRLEARPIATLCIEAQERHERKEKSYRD